MSAMESIDTRDLASRAREITQRELGVYMQRTAGSMKATERARKVMPMGVPSSFQAYDPHPIVVRRAQAAWMEDVDGNRYVDFDLGFGALFAGHCNPIVRSAIESQLDDGTLFVTPCELNADVAEMLADRYKLPMWRFTNSGTEATMDAIRVARGVTGRDKIVKVEGGYHGHHDEVMISMKPPISEAGPVDEPRAIPATAGITRAVLGDTKVIPYNRPELLERALAGRDVAAFIVEPVMENIGICLPQPGYLQAVREITRKYGTMLIFDEVKTGITAGWGGATGAVGVQPDLVALAKSIGGGLPLGAFGGTAGVHGPDHQRQGVAPRHLQRQPAVHGCGQGSAGGGVHARGDAGDGRSQQSAWSLRASGPSTTPGCRRTPCSSVPRRASRGRRSRSRTTATTRPPTSTSRSPSGCTASTAAFCCRRVSTSSG